MLWSASHTSLTASIAMTSASPGLKRACPPLCSELLGRFFLSRTTTSQQVHRRAYSIAASGSFAGNKQQLDRHSVTGQENSINHVDSPHQRHSGLARHERQRDHQPATELPACRQWPAASPEKQRPVLEWCGCSSWLCAVPSADRQCALRS